MATIPVEKKTGTPWWLWLLGLLLLALLAWFFLKSKEEAPARADTTDQTPLATPTDLNLADVWITRVVDGNTFFVAADSAGMPETLVHIDGAAPTPAPMAGHHVSLAGTTETLGTQDLSAWGLTADQAATMTPESRYVRATGLTMLDGGMAMDEMPADTAMTGAMPAVPPAAAPSTGTITTTEALYGTDLKPIIGRRVELDDATVLTVNGDSTFYVGSGGKRFLVALSHLGESQSGPGDGSDGRFNIDAGQKISLRGTVTAFDAASSVFRGLSASDRTDATRRGAFVNVTRASDVSKK